jgi:hypothetical protein
MAFASIAQANYVARKNGISVIVIASVSLIFSKRSGKTVLKPVRHRPGRRDHARVDSGTY